MRLFKTALPFCALIASTATFETSAFLPMPLQPAIPRDATGVNIQVLEAQEAWAPQEVLEVIVEDMREIQGYGRVMSTAEGVGLLRQQGKPSISTAQERREDILKLLASGHLGNSLLALEDAAFHEGQPAPGHPTYPLLYVLYSPGMKAYNVGAVHPFLLATNGKVYVRVSALSKKNFENAPEIKPVSR